jgi:hypothetical protein
MMQTVLNVGINDQIVENMAHISLNPRWAYDTYRRFLQMFGNVVLNLDEMPYEEILSVARSKRNVPHDSLLEEEDLKEVVKQFKLLTNVPDDPWVQLDMAIQAVFRSWNSPRAVKYRDINNISADYGTAVVVQSMVYGNLNAQSGSGVAFTRNPTTGAKELYGEYLPNSEVRDNTHTNQASALNIHVSYTWRTVGRGRERGPAQPGAADGPAPGAAGRLRRAHARGAHPRKALPRHAGEQKLSLLYTLYSSLMYACCSGPLPPPLGHRVHGGEQGAVHPGDAHRQAHGPGQRVRGGRHGAGEDHHRERGAGAH